jgi:hypothetical protein
METSPEDTSKIGTSSDTIRRASSTDIYNSRSSHPSPLGSAVIKRPLHAGNVTIFSDTIFDETFEDVIPNRPTSSDFGHSFHRQSISTASAETGQTIKTAGLVLDLPSNELEIKNATNHKFDDLSLAEVIDTARPETGESTIIFATMLDFSFQDTEGKWQAYCRSDNWNSSVITPASLAESGGTLGGAFGLLQKDVKGKKPVYHGFIEDFDTISSMYNEPAAETPSPEAIGCHATKDSSTRLICTCTPSDAKLALELYLESTKKQHKRLKHSLRRAGGLAYFLSSFTGNAQLVQKVSELYKNVEGLRRLIIAEEMVSSVTMTEIHRLMDKALTPVSQQVSALCGEMMGMVVADDGWRKRRRAVKQKMKEDWKPTMRALVRMVDQADAWVQLVVIRITRVRWEW